MGKAAREKWKRRLEKIAPNAPPSVARLSRKPVDTWLGLLGVAAGIIFFLLEKTGPVIIGSLIVIFILFVHPVWNFWWIEKSTSRRSVILAALAGLLVFLGVWTWPRPMVAKDGPSLQIVVARIVQLGERKAILMRVKNQGNMEAKGTVMLAATIRGKTTEIDPLSIVLAPTVSRDVTFTLENSEYEAIREGKAKLEVHLSINYEGALSKTSYSWTGFYRHEVKEFQIITEESQPR